MKKIHKSTLIFLVTLFAFLVISCNDDYGRSSESENIITYEDLPEKAREFLTEYFDGKDNVSQVEKETINDIIIFHVDLNDGYYIVFNAGGYWQEIDAPEGKTIPAAIIPQPIRQTLNERYFGYGVVVINTEGENYHIVLGNMQGGVSIDLLFNQSGEILNTGEV